MVVNRPTTHPRNPQMYHPPPPTIYCQVLIENPCTTFQHAHHRLTQIGSISITI